MSAMFSIVGLLAGVIKGLFGLAAFVFWLWMLIHALTNPGIQGGEKVAWVLVIIFLPCLGALIYFFVGRPKGSP